MNKIFEPVFIIGNPRSGTSLLRLVLNSHPEVYIPPESHFFLWLENKYENWNKKDGLDKYITDLFNCTKFETWKITKHELKSFLKEKQPIDYKELNALVYKFYSIKNGFESNIWGDKNKLWKEKLFKITHYYPNAKFIHIYRDGRDIACSYRELNDRNINSKYAPKLANDIKEIAINWKTNINFIKKFLSSINPDNFIEISYEDLLRSKVAKNICNFLDLHYPENGLNHLDDTYKNFDEPIEFLQWKEKTNKPIELTNTKKFLNSNYIKAEEINFFNHICQNELKEYNYL